MKHFQILLKHQILVICFFAILISGSCKKDDKKETPEPTKKELLSNKWNVTDLLLNGTSVYNLNIPQVKCAKDNVYTLAADNTYTIEEGAIVCDPSTAGSGTWALSENDTKLQFTPQTGDPLIFTINELTTTTLKFSYTEDSDTYTIVSTKQ